MGRIKNRTGRNAAQGHAMTEAVIILPVMSLFWLFSVFVGGAYEKAVDLGEKNRRSVLRLVTNDCDQTFRTGPLDLTEASAADPMGPALDVATKLLKVSRVLRREVPGVKFRMATYTDETTVSVHAIGEQATVKVVYGVSFMCAERHLAGGDPHLESVADEAWAIGGVESWSLF